MSLPNRVYGVLRAEVKEKVFSDSISMFSEMPVDIQVKNGSAVLLEYNLSLIHIYKYCKVIIKTPYGAGSKAVMFFLYIERCGRIIKAVFCISKKV